MIENVCYQDHDHKRETFARVTVPSIFAAARAGVAEPALHEWLNFHGVLGAPRGLSQLRALHETARGSRYVPGPRGCDSILDVSTVIDQGGDCDNWAAVLLAAAAAMGYPARLHAFGTARDPHEHVAVAVFWAGAWRYLDAKGDQEGEEFLQRPRGFSQETVYAWNA
jgi:hypothetical protein